MCLKTNIPCSKQFSLIHTLGEPVLIREWNIFGLPADNFSVENGIIVFSSTRWPLMIDPQGQANKWIKALENTNNISVIKLTNLNYMTSIQLAIEHGLPVLLENVQEDIDATLGMITNSLNIISYNICKIKKLTMTCLLYFVAIHRPSATEKYL